MYDPLRPDTQLAIVATCLAHSISGCRYMTPDPTETDRETDTDSQTDRQTGDGERRLTYGRSLTSAAAGPASASAAASASASASAGGRVKGQ